MNRVQGADVALWIWAVQFKLMDLWPCPGGQLPRPVKAHGGWVPGGSPGAIAL